MPYKSEKIKIAGTKHDRRIKLTEQDKIDIRKSNLSQRKLAAMYNVSRRLIQFVLSPEKLKDNIKRRNENGGSKKYYVKEKHKDYMKNHRRYKQKLYIDGQL